MKNNFTSPSSFKYLNISILKEHLPSFGMVQMNFSSFSEFLFDRYTRVQCPKVEKQIIIVLHFDEFLSRCNLDHPVNHGISNINACFCKYNFYIFNIESALFFIFHRCSANSKTKPPPILLIFVKVLLQISIWTLQLYYMILKHLLLSSSSSSSFVYNFFQIF